MEIERRLPGGLNFGSEPITAFAAASRGNRFLIEPAFPTLMDLQSAHELARSWANSQEPLVAGQSDVVPGLGHGTAIVYGRAGTLDLASS